MLCNFLYLYLYSGAPFYIYQYHNIQSLTTGYKPQRGQLELGAQFHCPNPYLGLVHHGIMAN